MTEQRSFNGWRPALAVLALGIIAIGLSMRGASAEKEATAPPEASAPSTNQGALAAAPTDPSTTRLQPLRERPGGDAGGHETRRMEKSRIARPELAQFDTWVDGYRPDVTPPAPVESVMNSPAPQSPGGGTAGPPATGACCTNPAPGSCVCDIQPAAACIDANETHLGDNTVCASSVCDCNANATCDAQDISPGGFADCDMDGLLDVCNDACPLGACCNLTGGCIGDIAQSACESQNFTWHPNASCSGTTTVPFSALPPPKCNVAATCSWDNGDVLDDRGRPRNQHDLGALVTSAVADDFILIDKANPNNPCLMTDVLMLATHIGTAPAELDGVNITVYEELVAPARCETDVDCIGGTCVGTMCDTTPCFCSGDPKGPAGEPLDPTNAQQDNTHVASQLGGVVYSQFIPFIAVGGRVTVTPLTDLPCGGRLTQVDVDLDPSTAGVPEIAPLILNKNRKYWFEFQAVEFGATVTWFDYRSENNTGHRALRGFGNGTFWTDDVGNSGATEVGCAGNTPPANTRRDMTFKLFGTKLPAIPPVVNDLCANRITVSDGAAAFNNTGAGTDGSPPGSPGMCAQLPSPPCNCLPSPTDNITNDVWYEYTGTCFGIATIDTCGSAFDTVVAVYSELTGPCPPAPATQIACNNDSDSCGAGSLQSEVTFLTEPGETFLIRVGGRNGAAGKGRVAIRCTDACGDPDADLCCQPEGTPPPAVRPGCQNATCCDLVCAIDPGCCGAQFPFVWDQECDDLARTEPACQCPCDPLDPTVPPTATMCNVCESGAERDALPGTVCGASSDAVCGFTSANWGCFPNVGFPTTERSTPISCGQTACGKLFAADGVRDNDFYRFTVVDPNMDGKVNVKLTLVSDIPAAVQLQEADCDLELPPADRDVEAFGFAATASCEPEALDTCVPPGDYYAWVVPATLAGVIRNDGFPCGTQNDYKLTVECTDVCPTGACCSCGGSCFGPEDALDCRARGDTYTYAGNNLVCGAGTCLAHRSALATEVFCDTMFFYDNRNLAPCTQDSDCAAITPALLTPLCDTAQGQCRIAEDPDYTCDFAGPHTGTSWFKFVAQETSMRIQTCDSTGSATDSLMEIYTATSADPCETLTVFPNACSEDECGPSTFLGRMCVTGLTIGQTYYIQFSAWEPATLGVYTVDISCPCEGACCDMNADTCQENVPQTACNQRFAVDTLCADLNPPCGDGACCLPNGTCNATALTLAACNSAGGNWFPGAACGSIICNLPDSCDWDNGMVAFLSRANSSQYSTGPDASDVFIAEVADDFILFGDGGNQCDIETVVWKSTHFNHQVPLCEEGGSPPACTDTPEDYVSIRVTIYEDTGGPFDGTNNAKGPAGQPAHPPDGTHIPTPTDPVNGPVLYERTVMGPPRKGPPPGGGDWFSWVPGAPGFGTDFDISVHFDPPLAVEKNKKMWLAVAPELPFGLFYQTARNHSNNFDGNRGQQYFAAADAGAFSPVAPVELGDPVDFCFQIIGAKAIVGCGECQLYGDIVPAAGGGNLNPGNCVVDLDDILCVLDDFANVNSCAGDGNVAPCAPNVVVDLDDILAILDAFAGDYACPHPCPPTP